MSSLFLLLLALLAGLALGALATAAVLKATSRAEREAQATRTADLTTRLQTLESELTQTRAALSTSQTTAEQARTTAAALEASLAAAHQAHTRLEQSAEKQAIELRRVNEQLQQHSQNQLRELQAQLGEANRQLESTRTTLAHERTATEEKLAMLTNAGAAMTNQFKTLATEILEEKTKRFTDHNKQNLDQLLTPLRDRLGEFQLKVETLHHEGDKGRAELRAHIESLSKLNARLSEDATNLARALKGSSKTQGDWGEVLLAGILEAAGLRENHEFHLQTSFTSEEGQRSRPDVIINLPQGKHLVIDSKVSLAAYTTYCSTEDDPTRQIHLESHTRSVRTHIDGLSLKAYQNLHQLQSLDFVIMFVPIEPAYLLALAHDGNLWTRAWERNVLLVSPSTLYPILRTIQYAWQTERQTRNVEEIVRQGSDLYDKVAAFAASFEDVGKKLDTAQTAFTKARTQLTGKGSVIRRVENLRQLGVKSSKTMPPALMASVEAAEETTSLEEATEPLALEPTMDQPTMEQPTLSEAGIEEAVPNGAEVDLSEDNNPLTREASEEDQPATPELVQIAAQSEEAPAE